MHGDDDGADKSRGKQQANDFQRQDVFGHELMADLADGDVGLRWRKVAAGYGARGNHSGQESKYDDRDGDAADPRRRKDRLLRRLTSPCQENRKNNEDGNRADIDENLGEA